jgi:hypothetical protein
MTLTNAERAAFLRDGLIIRRGTVGPEFTDPARQLVDDWYREHLDARRVSEFTQRTFAPELGSHQAILNLLTGSGARDLAVSMLGQIAPVTAAQIQIRIPEAEMPAAQPVKAMHVDGVGCPHLEPAELRTFSLLVGIPLSDTLTADGGALRYLPGGHTRMSAWFATEWSAGITEQVPPDIDAQAGTPFLGAIGDLLLMHHLVPHAVGRNHTSTPRTMVYFRLSHPAHASRRLQALRDPWLDYGQLTRPQNAENQGDAACG